MHGVVPIEPTKRSERAIHVVDTIILNHDRVAILDPIFGHGLTTLVAFTRAKRTRIPFPSTGYLPIRRAIMNTKLKFALEKETKGAVRYQEVGEDGAPAFAPQVGTLYVRKSAMPDGKIPKMLIVTIASE